MDPKQLAEQVQVAGRTIEESNQTIEAGGTGAMNTVHFGPGIGVRVYFWASGGDPDRPVELSIGSTKIRMKPGEAGLLMKMLERAIQSWCIFEAGKEEILDEAFSNAKDGTEN